jgi:hypothetical protein
MNLRELIARQKRELSLTYARMGEKAAAAGYPLSRSMFHHLAENDITNIPPTDSLLGIAAAIDVDADVVLNAAAESVGIQPREVQLGASTRGVLALLEQRSPEEIAALESVLRSVAKAMDTAAPAPLTGDS